MVEPKAAASAPGLSAEGCASRRQRLRAYLAEAGLDAAVLCDRAHLMWLTNVWLPPSVAGALFMPVEGPAVLALPANLDQGSYVEQVRVFEAARLGTLRSLLPQQAVVCLQEAARQCRRVGVDHAVPAGALTMPVTDVSAALLGLRRCKDTDEFAMIRHAVSACEAAYAWAWRHVQPGMSELEVYVGMLAAATTAAGEPIGELGNDFQAGTPGGPPRPRRIEAGELMPLDVSVVVRGYRCDLCRTLCVGHAPTAAQQRAYQQVRTALETLETQARAGARCRELYDHAVTLLVGDADWRFGHHLGHGIGLSAHETPRLNPHWDDVLIPGDVFTMEPGLYGPALRGGVRLEQNYVVHEARLERLSHFPLEIC